MEKFTNEYIAKELTKLRETRDRLENEYECVAFKCRHGIGDVEANREEAYRLGRILGMRNNDIRVDTQTKSDNIECKNPKNKSVIEYLDRMKKDVLNAEKEIDVFTMIAVSESFGIATGSIGSASQLTTAIAFLINDLEGHSKKKISLLPAISKMYLEVKNEMSGKHDSDD